MKDMHLFDEEEQSLTEDIISYNNTDKLKLLANQFSCIKEYVREDDTLEDLVILKKAYEIDAKCAEALSKAALTTEERKVALFGFKHNLNVLEQLEGGEYLNNLILLIKACECPEFEIKDYFDETMSYINYEKIKTFLKNRG